MTHFGTPGMIGVCVQRHDVNFWLFLFQNSTISIEEFHAQLQEATNFPLRPFVIPFLKVC